MTKGKIGFHGCTVKIEPAWLRGFDGKEQAFPSWEGALREDWLVRWAMNQMLINVSTCKFNRSVRLPEGNVRRSPFVRQGPLHRMSIFLKPRRLRSLSTGNTRFALFNIKPGHPLRFPISGLKGPDQWTARSRTAISTICGVLCQLIFKVLT
jgi:hypothetical protein